MRKHTPILLGIIFLCNLFAQSQNSIKGIVVDSHFQKPLYGVSVQIGETFITTKTSVEGYFILRNVPTGNQILQLSFDGYQTKKILIEVSEKGELDLGLIVLYNTLKEVQDLSVILLSEDDLLEEDTENSENITGLLQSSKDVFLKTAAFNLGQARFRVRGYDSSNGTVLINGVPMNKIYDGRPQWGNWGGLNDVLRNREFTNGLALSEKTFGGVLGATVFNTRASEYGKTTKISYSATNGNYSGRIMATHASGIDSNGWAYVVSASRRFAKEGYFEGSSYKANSFFMAVEKKLNAVHSLNLTTFFAHNKRGKSSPNTQEVYDLGGLKYNAYWGGQKGKKRNSRIKEINEPIVMLGHYWDLNEKVKLQTNIAYQFGKIGNSRLGYFNVPNPDPSYYKYLPSYYLRSEENRDFKSAYGVAESFRKHKPSSQSDWQNMYEVNADSGNSLYYVYEDRVDDRQFSANSILSVALSERANLNSTVNFRKLTSKNYAKMLDLLGGTHFNDLDPYTYGNARQPNLNNLNRKIHIGDDFAYNYEVEALEFDAFVQWQKSYQKTDYHIGVQTGGTSYQRKGLYRNGAFPENSFGKGKKQPFSNFGIKSGVTYKFNGRHIVEANLFYEAKAPTLKNVYTNVRINHEITPEISRNKVLSGDINYYYRGAKTKARLTGYYTTFDDLTETSFFFAQGLRGDESDFVSEILTGVSRKHMGLELGLERELTSTLMLNLVAAVGDFRYANNPNLYVQSESITGENSHYGTAYLKNYRLSGTPQRAFSAGLSYNDPSYWWLSGNVNYLFHNYLDIAPILRTNNFYLDTDGIPFTEITQQEVDQLLTQEKFDAAFLVNLVGGKSWKVKERYFGFFASVNNLLGAIYKTGGFEQSRNVNYPLLKEDKQRAEPLFSPKYWYGYGTTYYLNFYIRF